MNDEKITALIFAEIEKRGITWKDMLGGRSISHEVRDQKVFQINFFKSEKWSDRLIELVCKGPFDPEGENHALKVSLTDMKRFWWNHCIDQDDMLDGILEDVFGYFKDQLLPKQEEAAVIQYDVNFEKVIADKAYCESIGSVCNDFNNSQREDLKMKNRMNKINKKMFQITSICRQDIIHAFKDSDKLKQVMERVAMMDDREMRQLAGKLADDYCHQLFWDSLKVIFESRFLNGKEGEK